MPTPVDPVAAALADPDSFATTLLVGFIDRIVDDENSAAQVMAWDPQTIRLEAAALAAGGRLPPRNFDKLMAAVKLHTDDGFWQRAEDFVNIANVLSDSSFEPGVFDPADVLESSWALIEACLMAMPENPAKPVGPEVEGYLVEALKEEGYAKPPKALGFLDDLSLPVMASAFADDPDMASAITMGQMGKADEVDAEMASRLSELAGQLEALKLRNGDAGQIIAAIRRRFQAVTAN